MKRQILKLIESNLTAKDIVTRLTESVQEEETQKPMRESRRRRVEEAYEDDKFDDEEDEY